MTKKKKTSAIGSVDFTTPLQASVTAAITNTANRLLCLNAVTAQTCELIRAHGLDPADFEMDMDSYYDYLEEEWDTGSTQDLTCDDWYNGVAFYMPHPISRERAASTGGAKGGSGGSSRVLYGVETMVNINEKGSIARFKLEMLRLWEGQTFCERWADGRWVEGPPARPFGNSDDREEWDRAVEQRVLQLGIENTLPVIPSVITKLNKVGIRRLADLIEWTEKELLQIDGIGIATVARIQNGLNDLGFELKG